MQRAGLTVVAIAATMADVTRQVDHCLEAAALPPVVVLLHQALPGASKPFLHRLARAGAAMVLLVDTAARRAEDVLARDGPYADYVLAQMERLHCASVATWPPVPGELPLCLAEALEILRARPSAGGRDRTHPARTGGTIAVTGGAGGSGKTQIACNLAAHLAVLCERRVLLMDVDLLYASVHTKLGLEVAPTCGLEQLHAAAAPLVRAAAQRAGGRPQAATGRDEAAQRAAVDEALRALDLDRYVVPYPAVRPAGRHLDVLAGVTSDAATARLLEDLHTLHALVRLARTRYDDVILDLGTETTMPQHEQLAARADRVLVVTWPTPDSVERVADRHRALQRATGLAAERCQLVINHVPDSAAAMLPPLEIMARLHAAGVASCAGIVPHDGTLVGEARLAEVPLVPVLRSDRAARTSPFVRSIDEIVDQVRPGALPERGGGIAGMVQHVTERLRPLARGRMGRLVQGQTDRGREAVGG